MPKIINAEGNISIEINLIKNEYLDIEESRDDFENWIPFEFELVAGEEKYSYSSEAGATFSLYEIKNFISNVDTIIQAKMNNSTFERYVFCSSECYFDLELSDPLEKNQVSADIWINLGSLTKGKTYGYDKGFRFDINLDTLKLFINTLKQQLKQLTTN